MKILFLKLQVIVLFLSVMSCGKDDKDSSSSSSTPCSPCIIFVTSSTNNGNLGGVSGADSLCNSDSNKPNSSTYKAMVVSGTTRRACTSADCQTSGTEEHVDWVLKPSVAYQRADGTSIATSTAQGVFSFNLTDSIGTAGNVIWTGLDSDWTATNECSSWSSSNSLDNGGTGTDNVTTLSSIAGGGGSCDSLRYLYCVEQ